MIRYALKCKGDHGFDSWFQNAAAFDGLAAGGHLSCPTCGSRAVTKALMTPTVRPAEAAATVPRQEPPVPSAPGPRLSAPANPVEAALQAMRRQIEANSDYVGLSFAAEARAMHLGEVPERAIHGEANPEEARRLIEDGIPVAPLPFLPVRKTH